MEGNKAFDVLSKKGTAPAEIKPVEKTEDRVHSLIPEAKDITTDYICSRDFRLMIGSSLQCFLKGQVVDDPMMVKRIYEAFSGGKPPLRPVHPLDLVG
jgi:hypothetical protein